VGPLEIIMAWARAFEEAGIPVANAPSEIPKLVKKALRR